MVLFRMDRNPKSTMCGEKKNIHTDVYQAAMNDPSYGSSGPRRLNMLIALIVSNPFLLSIPFDNLALGKIQFFVEAMVHLGRLLTVQSTFEIL